MDIVGITPRDLGIPETIPLPKRKDLGIGMVGFGWVARDSHAPCYRSAGWPIAAVADPDPAAQNEARDNFGIPHVCSDYRELIADEAVEVVDLCTQPNVRAEVVIAAAEAGKHIIVEKPLAETVEECERMVQAAERAGVKLAVHQNYRWYCMCFYAHHIIQRGLIGEPFFAGIEICGPQDVLLAGHPFYSKCGNFLTVQWASHTVDLLRYLTARDAVRVFARTARTRNQNFVSDTLMTMIADFGEGLTGHIMHHELLRSSMEAGECRVDGDKGSVVFDFDQYLRLESSLLGEGVRTLDVSGIEFPDAWCGTMGDLLISIEENREPLVSGRRNLATMRTVFAMDESAKAGGKWVDIG